MAFVRQKVDEARIKQAEDELAEVLSSERPEEAGAAVKDPKEEVKVPEVVEGVNWKERYGNLQSWVDKILKPKFQAEIDKQTSTIRDLTEKVNGLIKAGSPANLPETAEELETMKRDAPKSYAAIMRLAEQVAEGLVEEKISGMRSDIEEIKRARKQSAEEAAFVTLQKLHPDIDILSLETDEEFNAWIKTKSKRTQDALFSNKEDVEAASEVLELYKLQVLSKKAAPKGKKVTPPGADDVQVPHAPNIPVPNAGWDFTESQLEEMDRTNPRWFEQNAEKISEALNKGRVLLDISDPVGSQRRMARAGV